VLVCGVGGVVFCWRTNHFKFLGIDEIIVLNEYARNGS